MINANDTEPPQKGERVDSITYYTNQLAHLNDSVEQLQKEKKAMAEKGNISEKYGSDFISHFIGVTSDVASLSLVSVV